MPDRQDRAARCGGGHLRGVSKMAREEASHNAACDADGHDRHLCFLMYEGFHYSHKDEYRKLVQDAHFRCQNCGRTAKSADNLCAAVEL